MEDIGVLNVWRDVNPTKGEYTHYSDGHKVYSRIDYIFMFRSDFSRILNCEIGPCTVSDDNPVYVQVLLAKSKKITLWRLNKNILNYPKSKESLRVAIKEYFELNDNDQVSPGIL